MKSILKLIKRFIVTMLFSLVLLLFLNFFLLLLISYKQAANHGAWSSADTVASATETGWNIPVVRPGRGYPFQDKCLGYLSG